MTYIRKNHTTILLLMGILLLVAAIPAFAQTPVPVNIDTNGLTNGINTGINGIFNGMITFLGVAVGIGGFIYGFPLAFQLIRWLGGMISKIFSGGLA